MIKKIFKYPLLPKVASWKIDLPKGAKILSVAQQHNQIVMYAIVNPDETKKETYDYLILGTGREIPQDISAYTFMNTVNLFDGELMFHVFIKKEKLSKQQRGAKNGT